jgi:CRISP-associated protein Cas1
VKEGPAEKTAEPEDAFKSHYQAEKTTDEPLIRVMALHALAYCERLFYLEEVEEIRLADANVYEGRRLHDDLDKEVEWATVELASERLGLRGKLDFARQKDSKLIIYEHKKGKSNKGVEAWPSDRLQVLAYALLLSEHSGLPMSEAIIHYHADNKKIKIPIEPGEALAEVQAAVTRARELRKSLERPAVTVPEKLCRTCSLAPVCLPEEERFVMEEKDKPQRLFPMDDDRRIIHIVEQGSSVRKEGEQLLVLLPDGSKKVLPSQQIAALVLHGNIQVSTQTIHFCAAHDIGVHWLSYGGNYVGSLTAGAGGVQRKNRQYQALQERRCKERLACRLIQAKVENQLRYLQRATRSEKETDPTFDAGIAALKDILQELSRLGKNLELQEDPSQDSALGKPADQNNGGLIDKIRGYEGTGGRIYFGLLPRLLKIPADDLMAFSGRNRRPPKDPCNALLSFGYALLYRDCVAALLSVGLEPALGFMHTPRSAAYPLALDLMELFRLILVDIPVIGSINRKQWSKEDFDLTGGYAWLNVQGRRKAIHLYESRKQEKWKHPVLAYSLSYARTIELEARLFEKEWTGRPGLFARIRLR